MTRKYNILFYDITILIIFIIMLSIFKKILLFFISIYYLVILFMQWLQMIILKKNIKITFIITIFINSILLLIFIE
jgi:hypothetical protein